VTSDGSDPVKAGEPMLEMITAAACKRGRRFSEELGIEKENTCL